MAKKFPLSFKIDQARIKFGDYRKAVRGDADAMARVIASCAVDPQTQEPVDEKRVVEALDDYTLEEIQGIVEQLTENIVPKVS